MQHPPKQVTIGCFNWRKLILETDLPANAKYLSLYLSTFMNDHQDVAWPSLKRIESETGLSHPTVLKYLKLLESEGWLVKQPGSRTESNRYVVNVPKEVGKEVTSNNNRITKHNIYKAKPETVADVCNYMVEKGLDFDIAAFEADRFHDYYTANGWKVGKNPMKDWKAAVRNWLKNVQPAQKNYQQPNGRTTIENDLTNVEW